MNSILAAIGVMIAMEGVAAAGRAVEFRTPLVSAYQACLDPDRTHQPPATLPACEAKRIASVVGLGPHGVGEAIVTVQAAGTYRPADVRIRIRAEDVRRDVGSGAPFAGVLTAVIVGRRTDVRCVGGPVPCTMVDTPLTPVLVAVPCGADAGLAPGRCAVVTSANTVLPGSIMAGADANIEFGALQVYHDSELVFVQGLRVR